MSTVNQIMQRRRRRLQRRRTRQMRSAGSLGAALMVLVFFVILPAGVALGGAASVYIEALQMFPQRADTIAFGGEGGATELYDRSGSTLLLSVSDPLGETRNWVSLDDLPPYVGEATLLMEDPDFMLTRFSPAQTFGNIWNNILSGPLPADPSLTGRLVRNALDPSLDAAFVSATDRGREIALVAEVNRRFSPEEVLEWHLNTNYYGGEAYGIDAAARVYLNKSAADLTVDEAALLAAIPPAPQYNPVDNETAARSRQQDLLRQLLRADYITQDAYEAATLRNTPIQRDSAVEPEFAPDFTQFARRQAQNILNEQGMDGARMMSRSGLKITTTLDLDLFYQADCVLRAHISRLNGGGVDVTTLADTPCVSSVYLPPLVNAPTQAPPTVGSIVVIDAQRGELRALVGDPLETAYQPGPVLYPFVYFEGFRSALYTPATMMLDIPRQFPGPVEGLIYTPNNPDGSFQGPLNLRDAVGSASLPAVAQVAFTQGIDNVLRSAHRMGLNSMEEGVYDLSVLERGGAVSVLDVTYAYSVFASMGQMYGVPTQPIARGFRGRDPVAVLRIEDANGAVLWEYDQGQVNVNAVPIIDDELGYLVNDVLADQEARWAAIGQENALELSRPAAAVYGVTRNRLDAWTVGYTPQLVTGVRMGRDDGQAMTIDAYGMDGAAAVWRAVMEYAHERDALPETYWNVPENIIDAPICDISGLAPNAVCPVRTEIFLDSTQPVQQDPYWQVFEINSQSGQLATGNTPIGLRVEQRYFIPPEEAQDWWRANQLPLPPAEYDTVSQPGDSTERVFIILPEPFDYVGGQVTVRGSFDPTDVRFFRVSYGQGVNPNQWTQIGDVLTELPRDGRLLQWDTTGLDGIYNLRLSVVYENDDIETSIVQVTVDNQAPTVSLNAGDPDKIYRWPADTVIPLEAIVQDNLTIDRVEFLHNGVEVGIDTDAPFGFEWQIDRAGVETFTAVAVDSVGNESRAEITVEVVR